MADKQRLDLVLLERDLAESRSKAAAMIMAGEVFVNNQIMDKPGMRISLDAEIRLKEKPQYVGRGGLKLEGALSAFPIDINGKVCADVGASTGGFTDCLLQNGASKIYAIDVARGIIDYKLRVDERVILLENTNARYLESLAELVQIVVIDVSFISLKLILPSVYKWLLPNSDVIVLVKPQFEAGRDNVGKGGIVKDVEVHKTVLHSVTQFTNEIGFTVLDIIRSPITGQKGNVEYLMWITNSSDTLPLQSYNDKITQLLNN